MYHVIHPNRWFIWTLVILAIGGLLMMFWIQAYLLDLERDATAAPPVVSGWKTYTSKNLGFSIRYPMSWQIEVDPQEIHQVSFQNPGDYNENIVIAVLDPQYERDIRNSLQVQQEKDVTVDGVLGKWIIGSDKNDLARSNVVLVKRGGTLYYIAGNAKVFERIIKSIKFL